MPLAELINDTERQDEIHAALLRGELKRAKREISAASTVNPSARIDNAGLQRVAAEFDVAAAQVTRDHVISHILAALSATNLDITLYGGTALSRTLLPHLRLSEDIDLLARAERRTTALDIEKAIERALVRTHGEVDWMPSKGETSGSCE